ncbi:MAG: SelB C-terminal domain-containing protein, partial [Myxococcota bacterium]
GGVGPEALSRGDVITDDADVSPSRILDVFLLADDPISRGLECSFFLGTARSSAKVQPLGADTISDRGFARLRLTAPVVAVGGDRFVLRGSRIDSPTGAIVGGGIVLDAASPSRVRAGKRAALLEALHAGDREAAMNAMVDEATPRPLLRKSLAARWAIEADELTRAAQSLTARGELVQLADGWARSSQLSELVATARERVNTHHQAAPLDAGLPLQTLREYLVARSSDSLAEASIGRATADGVLQVADGVARRPDFAGPGGGAKADLDTARAALEEAGLQGITEFMMGEQLDGDRKRAKAVLAALVREKAAIAATDLWFSQPTLDALEAQLADELLAEGTLTIARFKEMTGLGRRQTIPLLEYFDRKGFTKRQGSDRVPGPRFGRPHP